MDAWITEYAHVGSLGLWSGNRRVSKRLVRVGGGDTAGPSDIGVWMRADLPNRHCTPDVLLTVQLLFFECEANVQSLYMELIGKS